MIFALLRFAKTRTLSDEALIAGVMHGRRAAQVELARRVGPVIRARILRVTRGRSIGAYDVDDLIQEVWSRLFEHKGRRLQGYSAARGCSLVGYVNIIAGQALVDIAEAQRAKKRRPEGGISELSAAVSVPSGIASPERTVGDRQAVLDLWNHLDTTLAPMGRLVLKGLYADHKSPAEIALELGIKRSTVDSWTFKIKRAAKKHRAERKISEAACVPLDVRGS